MERERLEFRGMRTVARALPKVSPSLAEIEDEWRTLEADPSTTPFQTFDWARAQLASVGRDAEPFIVAVGDPIEALLPLVIHRSRGVRRLRLLGHGLSDYLGPIPPSRSEAVLHSMGACLAAESHRYDILDLQGYHGSPEERTWLAGGLSNPHIWRLYERCPIIDTDVDWESFLASRTKKFRANLKRTVRQTAAFGEVAVQIEEATPELFLEMIDVERESWKWERGFAYLRKESSRNFLRNILLETKLPTEIWACRIDDQLASFAVVFRTANARYYYLPSFRAQFPDTGTFLLSRLVRNSCEDGIREVDLLQGDERYKMIWASRFREVHQLVAPGRGLRGAAAMATYRLRWRMAKSERLRNWRGRVLVALQGIRPRS